MSVSVKDRVFSADRAKPALTSAIAKLSLPVIVPARSHRKSDNWACTYREIYASLGLNRKRSFFATSPLPERHGNSQRNLVR